MTQTIHLVDILLHGYHGLFEEEKLVGNTFKINVTVVYEPSRFPITQLADTIDYGAVFSILQHQMQEATPLLETVAANFTVAVFDSPPTGSIIVKTFVLAVIIPLIFGIRRSFSSTKPF